MKETRDQLQELYAMASDIERIAMSMISDTELQDIEDFKDLIDDNILAASIANRISNATSKEVGYTETQSNAIYRVLKTYNKSLAENETNLNIIADAYTVLNARAKKLTETWQ
jgi:uncharacterized protein YaaR (DUF327 family)